MLSGLIEVHSHLLPAVDDGSRSPEESLDIARCVVERGYSQLVCTPHYWPDLPHNNVKEVARKVAELQALLDRNSVPLKLHPGGEINLHPSVLSIPQNEIPTYANLGRHVLADTWVHHWPEWLTPVIRHLQTGGRTVILAHPERLGLVHSEDDALDRLADLGVLFQGNMYCLVDPEGEPTRDTAETMLEQDRYFCMGGDLHRVDTLGKRWKGLESLVRRVGTEQATRLLRDHPATLLGQ